MFCTKMTSLSNLDLLMKHSLRVQVSSFIMFNLNVCFFKALLYFCGDKDRHRKRDPNKFLTEFNACIVDNEWFCGHVKNWVSERTE